MPIRFRCPRCESKIRVRDSYAGKAARCPTCKKKIRIPASKATGDPDAKPTARLQQTVRDQIAAGFDGTIEPVRKTMLYRVGVGLAACFVVLLPILYFVLIGAAGWGVYWHATENVGIASTGRGRARILSVMVYMAPIIAGAISVLFMLKPFLARSVQTGGRVSLHRAGQPLLFEFVERVCNAVNAPHPSRIDVSFEINASAGYGGGILSVVKSDLVLTVGLPLVAGMSLQQFAGVLAHEFGHFSQGAGMRVSWVIRTINHWFARVVYARDEWDEWLVETCEETDFRIGWMFYIARAAVYVSRGVLWCFMMLSHTATRWLARQMEFDADRYEARLAGSKAFETTCFQLHWLGYGLNDYVRNRMITQETGTANPIRDFIRHCDTLTEHDRLQVRRRIRKARTGFLDTHPADSERIENALREDTSGVFNSSLPAEAVFRTFDELCVNMMMIGRLPRVAP
jgi:Zn-dependent protease with chaperone function